MSISSIRPVPPPIPAEVLRGVSQARPNEADIAAANRALQRVLTQRGSGEGIDIGQLGERLRLGCRFVQDFRRNLFDSDIDFEHGREFTSAPAIHIPPGAQEFDVTLPQIEQQRMLTAIELLRKSIQRFRCPIGAIRRSKYADIQRLLLYHTADV